MEVYSLLATREESLDIIEFIEGVNRGELIEVEPHNLLSHLAEERVVELEKLSCTGPSCTCFSGRRGFEGALLRPLSSSRSLADSSSRVRISSARPIISLGIPASLAT